MLYRARLQDRITLYMALSDAKKGKKPDKFENLPLTSWYYFLMLSKQEVLEEFDVIYG